MAVVVVESPAKAKTINGYLGGDYTVLASYGHVRDLPAKNGSVDPEHGFEMTWEVDPKSQRHVRAIAEALAGALADAEERVPRGTRRAEETTHLRLRRGPPEGGDARPTLLRGAGGGGDGHGVTRRFEK